MNRRSFRLGFFVMAAVLGTVRPGDADHARWSVEVANASDRDATCQAVDLGPTRLPGQWARQTIASGATVTLDIPNAVPHGAEIAVRCIGPGGGSQIRRNVAAGSRLIWTGRQVATAAAEEAK